MFKIITALLVAGKDAPALLVLLVFGTLALLVAYKALDVAMTALKHRKD